MANGNETEEREGGTESGDVGSGKIFFARSGSVRATYFLCTKFILKTKSSGATRARSLCFILVVFSEKILLGAPTYNTALLFTDLCTPLFSFIYRSCCLY